MLGGDGHTLQANFTERLAVGYRYYHAHAARNAATPIKLQFAFARREAEAGRGRSAAAGDAACTSSGDAVSKGSLAAQDSARR